MKPEVSFDRVVETSAREQLSWADLVTVRGGNAELFRALASMPWKQGDDLPATLREHKILGDLGDAQFALPQRLEVKLVNGYSGAEFRRKLGNILSSQCADCRFNLVSVQDANVRLGSTWVIDETSVKPVGSFLVTLRSATANTTAWVAVQARVTREALVLKRSIPIGTKITAEDVETREADVSHQNETPARLTDLAQVTAMRTLTAGHAIFPSDLKREDLVKRGQAVRLVAGTDEFEVSTNGTSEDSGRLGDVVKVKTADGTKSLVGTVTGSGQVRLQ